MVSAIQADNKRKKIHPKQKFQTTNIIKKSQKKTLLVENYLLFRLDLLDFIGHVGKKDQKAPPFIIWLVPSFSLGMRPPWWEF